MGNLQGAPALKVSEGMTDSPGGKERELGSLSSRKMLPPEIWEGILEELEEPNDFLAAINSSPEWNQFIHHKKSKMLMPLVIPLLTEYLPLNTLLSLRLVNKSIFKNKIDPLLQILSVDLKSAFDYKCERVEHSRNYIQGKLALPSKLSLIKHRYNFSYSATIYDFLLQFPPTFAPILSKHISIIYPITTIFKDQNREGEEALLILLSHFGHYVSSLRLEFSKLHIEIPAQLHRLQPTLARLPNLKFLELNSVRKIPNRELYHLRPELLSDLPQLEFLSVKRFQLEDPTKMSDGLLILPLLQKYGGQLKALRIGGTSLEGNKIGVELLNRLLPTLKMFKAHHINPETMVKLGRVNWRLENLQLLGLPCCCRVGDLVNVLNNLGGSLTSLEILIRFPEREDKDEKDKVEKGTVKALPKLKTLTTAILNLEADWLWEILTKESVPKLEEIHFEGVAELRKDHQDEDLENMFTIEDFKVPFGLIPTLKKVVVWYENKSKLEIVRCRLLTCSDVKCRGYC